MRRKGWVRVYKSLLLRSKAKLAMDCTFWFLVFIYSYCDF